MLALSSANGGNCSVVALTEAKREISDLGPGSEGLTLSSANKANSPTVALAGAKVRAGHIFLWRPWFLALCVAKWLMPQ